MTYLLYFFGFLPSLIWLWFYLKKDSHPESNATVLKIFFYGILSGFAAIYIGEALERVYNMLPASPTNNSALVVFLRGALVEEYVKYLAVRIGVFGNKELDEPSDLVLYMIISALGFAALENILDLINLTPILSPAKALEAMGWRFVSTTFLHALLSGTFGYFLALSLFHISKRKRYFFTGLGISVFLHLLYNLSIINIKRATQFIFPIIILTILGFFVSFSFRKLKGLKGICETK